jgi:DNA polymerase/3'-5' exonuclease PolX
VTQKKRLAGSLLKGSLFVRWPVADAERRPLAEALVLAHEVVEFFADVSARPPEMWGSIRRGKPTVKDIEIGLVPLFENGASLQLQRALENKAGDLFGTGIFEDRPDKNGHIACGVKMQRLVYKGMALDIFAVTGESQFGVIKAIRTGSAEYSHKFMTQQKFGGNLPDNMSVSGGRLYINGIFHPTPEEEDFFAAIRLPWVEPREREVLYAGVRGG